MNRRSHLLPALTALLCLAPVEASAKDIADFLGSVASSNLDKTVDVPLYASPDQSVLPCVRVTINEVEYTFGLDIGDGIFVNNSLVGKLGLKPEENDVKDYQGTFKNATIASMAIGELVLKDVLVQVGTPRANPSIVSPAYGANPGQADVDGWIGLSLLPVAWAILPSEGVVRFAPLREQDAFLENFNGATVYDLRSTPEKVHKYGKQKMRRGPASVFTVDVGGQAIDVQVSMNDWYGAVRSDLKFEDVPEWVVGDRRSLWLPVSLTKEADVSGWMTRSGNLRWINQPQFEGEYPDAIVGLYTAARYDIIGTQNKIAFRYVETPQRSASLPLELEDVQKVLDEAEQKRAEAEEKGELKEEQADQPHGAPPLWNRLLQLQRRSGDLTAALETMQTLMAFKHADRSCTNWMTLGDIQRDAYQLEAARASYAKSAELYHAWWDNTLDERTAMEEERAELEGDAAKDAAPFKQPGICHRADAKVASLDFIAGDLDKVAVMYDEGLDLDWNLALIRGNAALQVGDISAARQAYRQALQMEARPQMYGRLGLAITYHSEGNWQAASGLYEKSLNIAPHNLMLAVTWVDAQIAEASPGFAARKAKALQARLPNSAAAYVAYARAVRKKGDAAEMAAVIQQGDAFFARDLLRYPNNNQFAAVRAAFLYETNRPEEAKRLAEAALLNKPDNVVAWLTLGAIYVESGEVDRGEQLLRRAGHIGPFHPGYALLVQAKIPRPVVEEGPSDLDEIP